MNLVAAAYVQACRAYAKLLRERDYSAVEDKLRLAVRVASEAQTRFELLQGRRLRALADRQAAERPTTIENPRWTAIGRRLTDLQQREKTLLVNCTLQHPSVQEIEAQIGDVRREMAAIPPRLEQLPTALSHDNNRPAEMPTANEVEAAAEAAQQGQQDLRRAQAAEKAARAVRNEELLIDLRPALPPADSPSDAGIRRLGKALVVATISLVGLAMVSLGAAVEPAATSVLEVEMLLSAPVLGVVPAIQPGRRPAERRTRLLVRWGWVAAGLVVLGLVVWLIARG